MAADPGPETRLSLLSRLRRDPRDAAAWETFVDRYGPKIYSWCRRWNLQEADAEDVAQDVLLRLAEKIGTFQYDPSRSFRAWLKTLTQHAWSDLVAARQRTLRASGGQQAAQALETAEAGEDLVRQLDAEFEQELLEEAMSRVRPRVQPKTWDAFRLTALEDLSGAEVAARLNMKITSVFVARSRVQRMLQEEVQKLDGSVPC
jgi:RNA polymerase sigma-70 factor (ECF subfamily)